MENALSPITDPTENQDVVTPEASSEVVLDDEIQALVDEEQTPDEPKKYSVNQASLTDFAATVQANPDAYTFEMAEEDFPELKGNFELFDRYAVYAATYNSGKYNSLEEVNSKFPEFSFEAEKAQEEMAAIEKKSGDGSVFSLGGSTSFGEKPAKPAKLPEVPRYTEPSRMYVEASPSQISFGVLPKGKAGEFRQNVDQSIYRDFQLPTYEIEKEVKKQNPDFDEAAVRMVVSGRKAIAIQKQAEKLQSFGLALPKDGDALSVIADAYKTEADRVGLLALTSSANQAANRYKESLNTPVDTPSGKKITPLQANEAYELAFKDLLEVEADIEKLNTLAEAISPDDPQGKAKFDQILSAYNMQDMKRKALTSEMDEYSTVLSASSDLYDTSVSLFSQVESARLLMDEETLQKGEVAIKILLEMQRSNESILSKKGYTAASYTQEVEILNSQIEDLQGFMNTPDKEMDLLDKELTSLEGYKKEAQDLLEIKERQALYIFKQGEIAYRNGDTQAVKDYYNQLGPYKKEIEKLKEQIRLFNIRLQDNQKKHERAAKIKIEIQKTLNDPRWREKEMAAQVNGMSELGKKFLMTSEDIASTLQQVGSSVIALGRLSNELRTGWFGQENYWARAGILSADIQKKQLDAAIKKIAPVVRPYMDELKGDFWGDFNGFKLYSIVSGAGASLLTSMAGTIASGGNVYVGASIGFAQMYGSAYYEAKEAGMDGLSAHLFASLLALPAAAGDKLSLSAVYKGLSGGGRAAAQNAIARVLLEGGGKWTSDLVLKAAKAAGIALAKPAIVEGIGEGKEYILEVATKYGYNALGLDGVYFEGNPKNFEDFASEYLQNSLGGAAAGFGVAIPGAWKTMVSPDFSAAAREAVLGDNPAKADASFLREVDQLFTSGSIDERTYETVINRYSSLKDFYKSPLTKSITNTKAVIQAAALVQEKNELLDLIKRSDKALTKKEADRIGEIDGMLTQIAETNKPVRERSILETTELTDPTAIATRDAIFGPQTEQDALSQGIESIVIKKGLSELQTPWFDDFQAEFGEEYKTLDNVVDAYMQARQDGSNQPLVQAVDNLLAGIQKAPEAAGTETTTTPDAIAAPKPPKKGKGAGKVRQLRKQKAFPKRKKPAPTTPETPQGIPVTATTEQQQSFADTPIDQLSSREGAYVNYQGVEGTLSTTSDGLPAVKTNDGSYYVIEGAVPGRSMAEVGIELVSDFNTVEASTPEEIEAIGVDDDTDATAVDTDFSKNSVTVYGADYEYVRTNTDADQDVVSVTLKDPKTGKEVTVRNKNIVYAIEEAKIRFELDPNVGVTAEEVVAAAESIGITQPTDGKQEATKAEAPTGKSGAATGPISAGRSRKNTRAAGGSTAKVNANEFAQRQKVAEQKGLELGVKEGVVQGMAAAVATSLNNADSAKKFVASTKSKNAKAMFEAASGITLTGDPAVDNAAIDNLYGTAPTAPQPTVRTQPINAVQEQTTGQVPIQPEAKVGEEVAQGEPQAKPKEVAKGETKKVTPAPTPAPTAEKGKAPAPSLKVGDTYYDAKGISYKVVKADTGTVDLELSSGFVRKGVPIAQAQAAVSSGALSLDSKTAKKSSEPEAVAPTPQEVKDVTGVKVANIRDLYNVNRTLFNRGRVQALVSAVIMDRLIRRRASLLGISPEKMYSSIEFKEAQKAAEKASSGVKFQLDLMHGSQHLFDKFLLSNVGGGEGYQMYGYGLYFTETDAIRQTYTRPTPSSFKITFTDPVTGIKYENISIAKLNALGDSVGIYRDYVADKASRGELFVAPESYSGGDYIAGHVYLTVDGVSYDLTAEQYPPDFDQPLKAFDEPDGTPDIYPLTMADLYADIAKSEAEGSDGGFFMLQKIQDLAAAGDAKAIMIRDLQAVIAEFNSYVEYAMELSEDEGVSVENLDEATRITSDRFLDFMSKRFPGLAEKISLSADSSAYSFWVTAFKNVQDLSSRLLNLDRRMSASKKEDIAKKIRERGFAEVGDSDPDDIGARTQRFVAGLLLSMADGDINDGETLAKAAAEALLDYVSSVNETLADSNLEMMVLPPVGTDKMARVVVVDKTKISPADRALIDSNYFFEAYVGGATSDPEWIKYTRETYSVGEVASNTGRKIPAAAAAIARASMSATSLNALVDQGRLDPATAKGLAAALFVMNQTRKDRMNVITMASIGSPLVVSFEEDSDNVLRAFDVMLLVESMFASVDAGSFNNNSYYALPKETRISFQKKATEFFMDLGYVGNKHTPGTAEEGEALNYVVFSEEDVSIDKTLKFQHEQMRTDTSVKFAADAETIKHAIQVEPGSDPIAMLVGAFETYLSEDERATVVKAAKTGTWTTSTSEFFRNHFLQYLAKGKTPFAELQKVFDKFKEWFKDIVSTVTGISPAKVRISDPMKKLYDNMLAPVNGKVDVPPALNPKTMESAPMPTHTVGEAYVELGGAFYKVASMDKYGNTTLDFGGRKVLWTKEQLAAKLQEGSIVKVQSVNEVKKGNARETVSKTPAVPATDQERAETKPAAPTKKKTPESKKTAPKVAAAQAKASKSKAPAIAARVEENKTQLAAAPPEIIRGVTSKNGVKRVFEQVFGLDKRKAEMASQIAERIMQTIANRQGISLKQAYERVVYARESAANLAGAKFEADAVYRGAMDWLSDVEAIIYALESPNVSTPMHELAHVYEKYLTDAEKVTIEGWSGAKIGSVEFSEAFARGFERFLYDGVAPSLKMKSIFESFAAWMKDIYGAITASGPLPNLNDKMVSIYSVMLGAKPVERKVRGVISDADITCNKSANYLSDGSFEVRHNGDIIGKIMYNKITGKWEGSGLRDDMMEGVGEISFSKKSDAVGEVVTRYNNWLAEPKAPTPGKPTPTPPPTQAPVPLLKMPPLTKGLKYKDSSGQEFEIMSVSGGEVLVNRAGTKGVKKMTVQQLSTMYGGREITFSENKAVSAKSIKGLDSDLDDLAAAFGRKVSVSTEGGQIGPRGESMTGMDADEVYELTDAGILNKGGAREVHRLDGSRIIKLANTPGGRVQNLAEGLEDFTPMVYESGNDYVVVESIPESNSPTYKSFLGWLKSTTAADWSRKTPELREKLKEYGLENMLNPEYELLYGDITAAENWGERDGQIILLDAGSLVAGHQKKGTLDKAEKMLTDKAVTGKEELRAEGRSALFQADPAGSPWGNLMATNPKAHRAVVKIAKKLIKANGRSANDVAAMLTDTIESALPDLGTLPRDVAFEYVVKAMAELGIQPDYTGMEIQPDEIELSTGELSEKALFERVTKSPKTPRQLKAALTKAGRLYDVENQDLASELAQAIVDEYGPTAAIGMVKAGIIKGGTGSFIYGAVIDKMSSEGAKYSQIAQVLNDFALHQRQLGRGIAAVGNIYVKSPSGLYYMMVHAMNQTNAEATTNAMGVATGLTGQLEATDQAAATEVANNIAQNITSGKGSISTAIPDLILADKQERLKALNKEADDIKKQLRGIGAQIGVVAPTPRIQALQSLNKLDLVVALAANFVKRGNVTLSIWSTRFGKSLSSLGINLQKDDFQYLWETNEVKQTVQDVLDSGLAPLEGPIKDYMRTMQIKLSTIIRQNAAKRTVTIENLANDIANTLAVDPAVATRLATAIKADIDTMSKKMQESVVKKFHDKMKNKYGSNTEASEAALSDLLNIVNMNQANPLAIAEAIKFAFGGVSMSDAQSDKFMKLAEDVFKTREGSRNRQVAQKRLVEFTNSVYPTKFGDLFWINFYPNQLAGISTQVVNTIGNFYNALSQSLVYAHQDVRNSIRMGVSYTISDTIKNLSRQIGAGLENARMVMETGIAGSGNKYADLKAATRNSKTIEDDLGYRVHPLTGLKGGAMISQAVLNIYNGFMMVNQELLKRYPVRFMTAVDNAFFVSTYEKSIKRQMINELYDKGLRGVALRTAVNEALYGTDNQVSTAAAEALAEMKDVGIEFFDKRALAEYILGKQISKELKAAINGLANLGPNASLPPLAQLSSMMQDETLAPLISSAILAADPEILKDRSLWSDSARIAVREIIHSRTIPANISDRAIKQSEYLTLKNTPEGVFGVMAAVTSMAVNTAPFLRFLVPYVNVPFNIANMFLDWFPLTSAARAYGLTPSSWLPPSLMQRFGVKPSSYKQTTAARYGLEYDPQLHAEQKIKAAYSAAIFTMSAMYFIGKALGDDEEEEGVAITGGLFNVPYDKAGKTQRPYTVNLFGEEFSYENTPLFLTFAFIGNFCDTIRELKGQNETNEKVEFSDTFQNMWTAGSYTAVSMFDALPIAGLEGILSIFTTRQKNVGTMSVSEKAALSTAQGLIKSLLTPVPILGNNFVKQMEQFYDPRKYTNDVFNLESFIARATGHVIVNTLDDDSLVMRDYLGREVVQYPGARNIKTLEISEKTEIDKYIYGNNLNFIPVSKNAEIVAINKGEDGIEKHSVIPLKDDVNLFNKAYTHGGVIMRTFLEEFLPLLKSLDDPLLERAIITSANEHQHGYVLNELEKIVMTQTSESLIGVPISENLNSAFSGWGSGRVLADGISKISDEGSILDMLRDISKSPESVKDAKIRNLRAVLKVKTKSEQQMEKIQKAAAKYNKNVNISQMELDK